MHYHKITVGNCDWIVIWRNVQDDARGFRIEVAEVWAKGYRKDNEVYEEIRQREAGAGSSPKTRWLSTSRDCLDGPHLRCDSGTEPGIQARMHSGRSCPRRRERMVVRRLRRAVSLRTG